MMLQQAKEWRKYYERTEHEPFVVVKWLGNVLGTPFEAIPLRHVAAALSEKWIEVCGGVAD